MRRLQHLVAWPVVEPCKKYVFTFGLEIGHTWFSFLKSQFSVISFQFDSNLVSLISCTLFLWIVGCISETAQWYPVFETQFVFNIGCQIVNFLNIF